MTAVRVRRRAAAALVAALAAPLAALAPAASASDLSPVDLIDLEVAYDTLTTQYYHHVDPQRLVDGARVGIVAYLRSRGIADPLVPATRATGSYAHDLHVPGEEVAGAILRYGSRVDPHALVYETIAGEVAALHDPYTVFFTADQERSFLRYLNPGTFGGIGVVMHIELTTGNALVDQIVPGGPAERAGLLAGDAIDAVDGVPLRGLSADDAQKRLRGKVGSVAQLSYERNGVQKSVRIVRASVSPPQAYGRMLPGGVAYIQLTAFGEGAAKDVAAQMSRLDASGAHAYVLDLRDNGGGYRDEAVGVSSLFVPSGPIVVMVEKNGRRTTIDATPSRVAPKPLIVLVNGDTASASEITAGAVQDAHTGTLVGARTFGKGLVQQMFPMPDGSAMKVTVERYYTAHGRDIDRKGIDPDVAVPQPSDAVAGDPARDPQLVRALQLLGATASPAPGR